MRVVFFILLCSVVNCFSVILAPESHSLENEIHHSERQISSYASDSNGESNEEEQNNVRVSNVKEHDSTTNTKSKSKISRTKKPNRRLKIAEDEFTNKDENGNAGHLKEKYNKKSKISVSMKTNTKQIIRKQNIDEDDNDDESNEKDLKEKFPTDNIKSLTSEYSRRCHYSNTLPNVKESTRTEKYDKLTMTTLASYPYAVSILRKGAHYATGALLNNKWILSCAGEFYNVRESIRLLRARLGSVDNKHGGVLIPLKRILIHPSYVSGRPDFDVALLQLASPVAYNDFIKPICVSRLTDKVIGAKFLTTYWPRLILKGVPLPPTAKERSRHTSLRISTQTMIPPDKCQQHLAKANVTIEESTLCLKQFTKHHSLCVPDAGAPVIGEDGIWGVISGWTSTDCLRNPRPYVFSRLSSPPIQAWLETQLQADSRP